MEHLSNDHEDHLNQHENSYETGHPVLSLLESQWKLRQQHDQNFPMEGKPLLNKYQHRTKVHQVYQFLLNRLASPHDGR